MFRILAAILVTLVAISLGVVVGKAISPHTSRPVYEYVRHHDG